MRGSDKHSPRQDDALAHEVEGIVQGGRSTHAQEWKDPEPSGEDQPDVDRAPNGDLLGGTAEGMTPDDVVGRSEIATYLTRNAFPGDRDAVVEAARDAEAPDRILALLQTLPSGRTYDRVEEVWEALGGGHEEGRF
jgi:hypothetical protein